jgi:hypothetical protein
VQYEQVQGPRGAVLQRDPRTGELKQVVAPDNSQPTPASQMRPPSGYMFTPEGTLAAIPGGPGDASRQQRDFAKADKLRDEYNAASKDFITIADNYQAIQTVANDVSAAGDLSLIFSYMKMLDPGSVVREQEFANAQNAGGVPDRVRAAFNKVQNGERLSDSQRKDFVNQANNLFKSKQKRHDATVKKRYEDMAKRNGIDPQDVISDLSMEPPQGPVQVRTPAEAFALPPGTQFITPDGQVRVKR